MRYMLILAFCVVPVTVQAQDRHYKTFGDWYTSKPDTNAMTDEVWLKAATDQLDDVAPKFSRWKHTLRLEMVCSGEASSGYSVGVLVLGVSTPADGRYRVDKHQATPIAFWQGVELSNGPQILLFMPDAQVSQFITQAQSGSRLSIEFQGKITTYSLNGFTAATSELPCTSW